MKIEDQVVSSEHARELKELGVKQDSLFSWIEYEGKVSHVELTKFAENRYGGIGYKETALYAAFTLAEVDEMLPDHVEKGNRKYYLFVTKTKKTEYFELPDYYISYVDISHTHYLHSEREDKGVDAHAKMWIYLIKEGIIKADDIK